MSTIRERIRLWIGDPGESLPSFRMRDHRGMFFSKRASATEDELHYGVADSADAIQFRQVALGGTDVSFNTITYSGRLRDNSGTYTATEGAGMGSGFGAQTKLGNEYCGRIQQDTGTSTAAGGALWSITYQNARPNSSYVVLLNAHNAATATILPHVTSISTTNFVIDCVGDPPDSTQMDVSWFIVDRA